MVVAPETTVNVPEIENRHANNYQYKHPLPQLSQEAQNKFRKCQNFPSLAANISLGFPISELFLQKLLAISPVLITVNRFPEGTYLFTSEKFIAMTGYSRDEIIGKTISNLNIIFTDQRNSLYKRLLSQQKIINEEVQYQHRSGEIRDGVFAAEIITIGDDRVIISVLHDVTDRKKYERKLAIMEKEIEKRTMELEEAKAALRVILRCREEDRLLMEEKIQANVNELVMPMIRKLKRHGLNGEDINAFNLLEACLGDITASFINHLSVAHRNMTPKEIHVAALIREGKKSKDIADLLGVSLGTVHTHRHNIRKKLHLKQKDDSLQTHLLSLD